MNKCFIWTIIILFAAIVGLVIYYNHEISKKNKVIADQIEYIDTVGTYHKYYYAKKFKELKYENKELYDSLKRYKDKLDYVIQFTHEKNYSTGKKNSKPTIIHDSIHDTITIKEPLISKTYQYVSEPNDTFQYKLNVNSYTEPNFFSITYLSVTHDNEYNISLNNLIKNNVVSVVISFCRLFK